MAEILAARFEADDEIYAQQYALPVVAYYSRRTGIPEAAREIALESPDQRMALALRMGLLEPGRRFWLVTLHHPHWRSAAEESAIAAVIEKVADRIDRIEDHNASATLYRVRDR